MTVLHSSSSEERKGGYWNYSYIEYRVSLNSARSQAIVQHTEMT